MSKILFSDVRTKTKLYDKIAERLLNEGHEVVWIVQNHLFMPCNYTRRHLIAYPGKKDLKEVDETNEDFMRVMRSDRMILYFNKNADHYSYYWDKLKEILEEERPSIVIGELGNFHTHMICLICKKQSIPFYDIEGSRYPPGRFSFHLYDKYYPVTINEELDEVSDSKVESLVDAIATNKLKPEYMKGYQHRKFLLKLRKFFYKLQIFSEYAKGERFCTVDPEVYVKRKFELKRIKKMYSNEAVTLEHITSLEQNILLYPMQMQPEFNLDVWGAEFRNQGQFLKSLSINLPSDWIIVVKMNPKAREDMSIDSLDAIKTRENLLLLDPRVSMDDIDEISKCVITVTGTVALERVFKRKPVISVADTFLTKNGFIKKLNNVNELSLVLSNLDSIVSNQISREGLMMELLKRSLKGRISEPLLRPETLSSENVNDIVRAFYRVIDRI